MNRTLLNRTLAILAGAVVAGSLVAAKAAPLDPSDIAAGAKWFVHVDFDAARASKVGERIHEEALKHEQVKTALAKIQNELGLDLEKDLHGATLYGTSFTPHNGVLIVFATADKAKFMAHLKAKPDFMALKTEDGERTLYTWTEKMGHKPAGAKKAPAEQKGIPARKDGAAKSAGPMDRAKMMQHFVAGEHQHTVWAAFPKSGVGVFADSPAGLKAALDVLGGKGGLSASSPLLPKAPKGTVFTFVATGLNALPVPAQIPLLKQLDSISSVSGESDGEVFKHDRITMTNADTVKQLKSVVDGLIAMAELRFADQPELLTILKGVKVEADGKTLTADSKVSSDDLIKFGEKVCEFIKKHHQEWKR